MLLMDILLGFLVLGWSWEGEMGFFGKVVGVISEGGAERSGVGARVGEAEVFIY